MVQSLRTLATPPESGVQFAAPIWQVKIIFNTSSIEYNALFWLP